MDDLKVMAEGGVDEQLLEPKETTDHTGKRWLKVGAGLLVVGVAIHFLLKVFLLVLLSENFLEFLVIWTFLNQVSIKHDNYLIYFFD